MKSRALTWALSGILACGFLPGEAFGEEAHVELILDASGSMFNRLADGRYRITAAKEALGDFVRALPSSDLNVGLRVYGSTLQSEAPGACRDSELVVPIPDVDRDLLLERVLGTQARGKTPIAYSLLEASRDLPSSPGNCLVILVTDGQEACDGDVRSAAQQLTSTRCESDLRIIGFDLDAAAARSFDGIGEFVNARDAAQLADELGKALATVVEIAPLAQAILDAPESVEAGRTFEVSWQADVGDFDLITVVKSGAPAPRRGRSAKQLIPEAGDSGVVELQAPVEPGLYEVRYVSDRVAGVGGRQSVRVTPADVALSAPSEVAAGRPFNVPFLGPAAAGDSLTIVRSGAPDGASQSSYDASQGSPARLHAPFRPGSYEVRYQTTPSGTIYARAPLVVLETEILLSAPSELGAGSPFWVDWNGPNGEGDYLTISSPTPTFSKEIRYTREGRSIKLHAPLDPGSYEIRYESEREPGTFASLPLRVTPARILLDVQASVKAGETFGVSWIGPDGDGDFVTVVAADAPDSLWGFQRKTSEGKVLQLVAPRKTGRHEVRYMTERVRGKVLARRAIEVE